MAHILCLETATEICSVALQENGQLVGLMESAEPFSHTVQITKMVQQCLADAAISIDKLCAVAVSGGPGSYTGLRVGASVAKGICYSLQIPLIAIDSLEALAFVARGFMKKGDWIISSIDARRQEVYASVYSDSFEPVIQNKPIILDQVDISEMLKSSHRILLTGNGSEKVANYLPEKNTLILEQKSSSKNMLKLSQKYYEQKKFVDMAYFSPNYIKPPNITKTRKKLL